MDRKHYIGFIIDNCVPQFSRCLRSPSHLKALLFGTAMSTSVRLMRFQWIADAVNNRGDFDLHYELYRPWRKYGAVIFLKSMGEASLALARKLNSKDIKIIFDANVDYFTPAAGKFYYDGMAPTEVQRLCATEMARLCDAVIADSKYISEKASRHNSRVKWIPDNVPDGLIISDDSRSKPEPASSRIKFFWSGESVKLFELLLIRDALLKFSRHIHLVMITNSLSALDRWYGSYKKEFCEMLRFLSHEFLEFKSIENLMKIYDRGGVIISPRFLDNTYNMGHTEWKISLGMARGCVALCSPQPSYLDLYQRAWGRGMRICENDTQWLQAFAEIRGSRFDWKSEKDAACKVVREHYATSVIADSHANFICSVINR